jgi:hypothetical protein
METVTLSLKEILELAPDLVLADKLPLPSNPSTTFRKDDGGYREFNYQGRRLRIAESKINDAHLSGGLDTRLECQIL